MLSEDLSQKPQIHFFGSGERANSVLHVGDENQIYSREKKKEKKKTHSWLRAAKADKESDDRWPENWFPDKLLETKGEGDDGLDWRSMGYGVELIWS